MTIRPQPLRFSLAAAALLSSVSLAAAQGGAAGQGGLSPDTPVLAPTPPGPSSGPGAQTPAAQPGPKRPLPPRDTPRAPQPGASAGGEEGGPKTPLPPRDAPRAQQPGQKAAAQDPDWPCVQVKVPTMSYGQMWAGPPLEDAMKKWRDDPQVDDLVDILVARRTKMEDAKEAIAKLAKDAGDKADEKLTLLFAGVFDELNSQRSQIMAGIERYSQKQRSLAERIKSESLRIAEKPQDMASQNSPEALKEQEQLNWDTRIYEERSQSLTYVCETPVILEQRAFDLGREIQSHLKQTQ
ncbi:hypothetical protein IHQ68_14540 [Chelatococcus sambhunathii]|uniref:Uncharacterized protein n=1 Tax=Chelatococcus sambhunathii TaxID=363953 RepID=A0ABU1DIC1_9HYPH|nr:hypothetical protein [Chelatococcus sambhunathii]MDR4307839.1 hypothetical protein [Chelatococcus sambhunathii]